MATNLPSCFTIQFLEQLLKFLVNFTLLKYVNSQRRYGFLITKELIFGFQILDLKDHFSASLISMSLHLRGQAVTKGRNIKNFVKSQPLFDVHRQYLQMFLIDLQTKVSRIRCRIFHSFAYFLKIWLDYHRVLSFISYPLVIVLHLELFENNLSNKIS